MARYEAYTLVAQFAPAREGVLVLLLGIGLLLLSGLVT
jgi:hypothetical protein